VTSTEVLDEALRLRESDTQSKTVAKSNVQEALHSVEETVIRLVELGLVRAIANDSDGKQTWGLILTREGRKQGRLKFEPPRSY
jgi:hypothetical protein